MAAVRRAALSSLANTDNNLENKQPKATKPLGGKNAMIPTRRTALSNIANKNVDGKVEAKRKTSAPLRSLRVNQNEKPAANKEKNQAVTKVEERVPLKEEEPQSYSHRLIDVVDIDAADMGESPQLCAEYAKDVYKYLSHVERRLVPVDYMQRQSDVNEKMRAILVDWLIQVHSRFNLLQETLYMTIYIVDRYLSVEDVARGNLQLVGVSAMLLASKYEEMYAPEVSDFVYITDSAYSAAEVRQMEKKICGTLSWDFSGPICLHFLRRFSKAAAVDATKHTLAKYLMELVLVDYTSCLHLPSHVAASALCLSIRIIDDAAWSPTLVHYSSYSEDSLKPCMKRMAELLLKTDITKYKAVPAKYASSKFMRISKLPELQGSFIKRLAES